MLVLTRNSREAILIGDDIKIHILSVRNGQVRLGIAAPKEVKILRSEIATQEEIPSVDGETR